MLCCFEAKITLQLPTLRNFFVRIDFSWFTFAINFCSMCFSVATSVFNSFLTRPYNLYCIWVSHGNSPRTPPLKCLDNFFEPQSIEHEQAPTKDSNNDS